MRHFFCEPKLPPQEINKNRKGEPKPDTSTRSKPIKNKILSARSALRLIQPFVPLSPPLKDKRRYFIRF
jgi:hypothetical protein